MGVAWYATYVVGFQIQRNPGWDAYWKQTIADRDRDQAASAWPASGPTTSGGATSRCATSTRSLRAVGIASIVLLLAFSIVKFPRGVIIHPQASAGQETQLAAPELQAAGDDELRAPTFKKDDDHGEPRDPRAARERAPSKRALVLDLVFTLILLGGARVLARSLIERPRRGSFVAAGQEGADRRRRRRRQPDPARDAQRTASPATRRSG